MSAFDSYMGKAKNVGDVISPSQGKTQVSTKEGGLFELSNIPKFVFDHNQILNDYLCPK